jgi:aerobic carbon-monoxide dehydrogenase medium subunit
VKAPAFAYAKPRTLAQAFELLAKHGDAACVIAGGQSLVAMLNLRLAAPEILVDIMGIEGLDGISVSDETLYIGALTRHRAIEQSPEIAKHCPLLAQAAPHIAHVAIRNSGTLGGSLALADPAAEWPACCLALDAMLRLVSAKGERRVAARDFFKGLYATALAPAELIAGIEIPLLPRHRSVFLELSRRRGDYAIVGVAAIARTEAGRLHDVRLAYLGGGDIPKLARSAMQAAEGKPPPASLATELARDLAPLPDLENQSSTKLHLANVLTRRALAALAA